MVVGLTKWSQAGGLAGSQPACDQFVSRKLAVYVVATTASFTSSPNGADLPADACRHCEGGTLFKSGIRRRRSEVKFKDRCFRDLHLRLAYDGKPVMKKHAAGELASTHWASRVFFGFFFPLPSRGGRQDA